MRRAPGCLSLLAWILITTATSAAASPSPFPDSAASNPPALQPSQPSTPHHHFERWVDVATLGVVTAAVFNDRWLTQETTEASSAGEHRLSRAFEPAGNMGVVAPAILLAYGAARLTGHPGFAEATRRVGISVAITGLATLAIKEAAGRARPLEAPDDPHRFQPFSGHASFPSGHTAVAFATATALARETHSRWVPLVLYPAAAVVGWSRVHDREHWTSDVVAGAALGAWTADRVERYLQERDGSHRLSLQVLPERRGLTAALGIRF